MRTSRWMAVVLVLAVAAAAGAVGAALRPHPPSLDREQDVWRLQRGRLTYRFHAAFRSEALFDHRDDPVEADDLAAARPADLARLRAAFLRALRLDRLEDVPARGEDRRALLESLGYVGGGSGR